MGHRDHGAWVEADLVQHLLFPRRETCGRKLSEPERPDDEPAGMRLAFRVGEGSTHGGEHDRPAAGQQGQRNHPARQKHQFACAVRAYFAIAAQAERPHVDGANKSLAAADPRAVAIEPWPALLDNRDIGCRAADVGDDEVIEPGQELRANDARGRPGQNGLDGPQAPRLRRRPASRRPLRSSAARRCRGAPWPAASPRSAR